MASMAAMQKITDAHGFIMAIAFAVLYPTGALIIRLSKNRNTVWIHAGWQIFTYICVLAGFGLGVYLATTGDQWLGPYDYHGTGNNGHPIIGTIVVAFLLIQPISGLFHHQNFKKTHDRSSVSHLHIWIGRIMVVLGIINGGLGLQLSGGPELSWAVPAYSAVAAVFFVAWMGAIFYHGRTSQKTVPIEKNAARDEVS